MKLQIGKNRIKIAHITTVDISLRYMLLNQLCTIQQAGYEVVGISAHGSDVSFVEAAGIRHIAVPMARTMTPLKDLLSLLQLYRVMRREGFTIVHTHTPKPGLLGQLAARMARVPIIVNTIHGFYFHEHMPAHWRRFYITMEKVAASCSSSILSQNKEDIQTAIQENICRRNQIQHLGNGIDIRKFNPEKISEEELQQKRQEIGLPFGVPVVGFVGRLVKEKGVLELMKAMQKVVKHFPSTHVLLVGPIDYEKPDAFKPETAQQYGLQDHCIFTGMRNDMPEMYALMDIFVLPSHREGFPRSLMEASVMGIPCVATDIRGCREAVEHGKNGLLVPLGNVQTLADAIIEILTDQEKAKRMGLEGQRIARERFDEQLVFEKVLAEYARLLREKGLPVPSEYKPVL